LGERLSEALVIGDDSAIAFLRATRPTYITEIHDVYRYFINTVGNERVADGETFIRPGY
jgi:hypothetical protein